MWHDSYISFREVGRITYMMDGQHQESPAPCTFSDDSDKVRVDGTEVVVMNAPGDRHTIIAILFCRWFPKHVAILGATVLRTPCHLQWNRTLNNQSWINICYILHDCQCIISQVLKKTLLQITIRPFVSFCFQDHLHLMYI